MPKSRAQKEKVTKELSNSLSEAMSAVVVSFTQMSVNDDNTLRVQMHKEGIKYSVVKKSLLKRALHDIKSEQIDLTDILGNVAVATGKDEVTPARILNNLSKKNEHVEIVAGFLEGHLVAPEKVKELANLPSKEELVAKTLAGINAPISGFVGVLSGTARNLIHALNAIKEAKS